jgi:dolichol-phosphate mannosyltransferase
MQRNRTLVCVPTYNEAENVTILFEQIRALDLPATDIMFIDDNSPDGTGQILDQLAAQHPILKVMHRPGKLGIGSAHQAGIDYAYAQGYDVLITMDADFTHSPSYIQDFINAAPGHDIVISSRYMDKDSLQGWNLLRRFLTFTGHLLTVYLLKMRYDVTGAFRLYQLKHIPRATFTLVRSHSYSFFFESMFILNFNRFRIVEIPIKLPPRTYGHSKMRMKDVLHSVKFLLIIYLNSVFNPRQFQL